MRLFGAVCNMIQCSYFLHAAIGYTAAGQKTPYWLPTGRLTEPECEDNQWRQKTHHSSRQWISIPRSSFTITDRTGQAGESWRDGQPERDGQDGETIEEPIMEMPSRLVEALLARYPRAKSGSLAFASLRQKSLTRRSWVASSLLQSIALKGIYEPTDRYRTRSTQLYGQCAFTLTGSPTWALLAKTSGRVSGSISFLRWQAARPSESQEPKAV